jgi:ceramide glucosyltransferase
MPTLYIASIAFALLALASCGYFLLCLWSASRFLLRNNLSPDFTPPVSILKPLRGMDREMYECFRSHCLQNYPGFEIIFGVSDLRDPAVPLVEQLQQEFPGCTICLLHCEQVLGPNAKVSNLAQMARHARSQYLVVSDSDIRVPPDYLRRVMAHLANDRNGLITCLYLGTAAATMGSRLEALSISTDFAPGVLAAWQIEGGLRFGLGSTLAFRRADLEKIGGFDALADYLADDYELGRRIHSLGRKVILSEAVVETVLPAYSFREFLVHQLRWSRTIRAARPAGHLGLIFTFGIPWALLSVLFACGTSWPWLLLLVVLLLRFATGAVVGAYALRDRQALRWLWLLPLRDLLAPVIWAASYFGSAVTWRGDSFTLREGKLVRADS